MEYDGKTYDDKVIKKYCIRKLLETGILVVNNAEKVWLSDVDDEDEDVSLIWRKDGITSAYDFKIKEILKYILNKKLKKVKNFKKSY